MSEKRGTKALELWCRRITDGYPGVNVQNMSTSWRDGLAFCAMIHHFRPDLIDFDSLDKNDIYGNNELAFRTAEQYLGIPALLDAEDMASCSVPDRLSILTYLSQFYQTFGGTSPARLAVNRTTESTGEKIAQVPESPNEKAVPRSGVRKDLCAVCGLPVFLAEKLVLSRVPYHRTCFRCARCNSQLTLGNYYETEEGQYCCESCPDEEISSSSMRHSNEFILPSDAASSEFLPDTLHKQSTSSEDSAIHDIFSQSQSRRFDQKHSYIPDSVERTSRLRLNFVSSQLFPDKSEQSLSIGNLLNNENSISLQKDDEKFQTTSNGASMSISEDTFDKHYRGMEICQSSDLFLKSESPENSRIENNEDSAIEVDNYHDGSELTETSLQDPDEDKSVPSNNIGESLSHIDRHVRPDTSYSLVQERRKMFEGKKNSFEESKLESLKSKPQTVQREKLDSPISSSNTIKIIVSEENDSRDNITNLSDAEKTEKICETVPVVSSSSPVPSSLESSEVPIPEEEEIAVDRTCVSVAADSPQSDATQVKADEDYPEDLNPFNSEEEDNPQDGAKDVTRTSVRDGIATNPFEDDTDTEVEESRNVTPPKPALRNSVNQNKVSQHFLTEETAKRRLAAPQINLNPFWSDDDDCDSETECREQVNEVTPVPKPRTIRHVPEIRTPERTPMHKDVYTLSSPIRSPESGVSLGGAYRKKKPAPMPPSKKESSSDQSEASPSKIAINAIEGQESTPHEIPKMRKTKRAPQPPISVSNTCNAMSSTTLSFPEPYIDKQPDVNGKRNVWEDEKTNKDEANRNRQSVTRNSYEGNFYYKPYINKSVEGKWKKKKGPAPPCPTPHRRKIKVMSLKDVKLELDEIELQQQGLEKQGVRLEQLIRSKCESGPRIHDITLGSDIEELVLELFSLVNEKNELFRRQAELMLLRRQQRLEEEHAEVEYEIRCLMSQHESTKTDFDKQKEEALIQRLVDIVERRNEIVDCLEMDRRREIEEDRSIHRHMDLFVAKNKTAITNNDMDSRERKKHKQNKHKESGNDVKSKKINKKDIDKDIDEIELKLKGHSKRKWF